MPIITQTGFIGNQPTYDPDKDSFTFVTQHDPQDFTDRPENELKRIKANEVIYFIGGEAIPAEDGTIKKGNEYLKNRDILALDYDFKDAAFTHDQFTDHIRNKLKNVNYELSPSTTCNETDVKYHLFIELDRPLDREEYLYTLRMIGKWLSLPYTEDDPLNAMPYDKTLGLYTPADRSDSETFVNAATGEVLERETLTLPYDVKMETWAQWIGMSVITANNADYEAFQNTFANPLIVPENSTRIANTRKKKDFDSLDVSYTAGKEYTREEAKQVIKDLLPQYLEQKHGDSYGGADKFYCLNPQHSNDSDPSMHYYSKTEDGQEHLFCYGCDANYDTFNLIAIDYNLSEFNDQLNKACEIFNISIQQKTDYEITIAANETEASDEVEGMRAEIEALDLSEYTINNFPNRLKPFLNKDEEKRLYTNTSPKKHLQSFVDHIIKSADTPPISTGFKELDKRLDGGLYEGLYSVGAISSLGKTTLMLQMTDQIAQQGKDVLIFSLEMSRYEIMAKTLSRLTYEITREDRKEKFISDTGTELFNARTTRQISDFRRYNGYVDAYGTKHPPYSDYQKEIIQRSIEKYETFNDCVYIHEGVGDIGVLDVRKAIEKHEEYTGNTPVVLIDYTQILAPFNDRATDKQNTDKAVTELKRIARDFKTPVLSISSFNRQNYNESVNMSAFKESGSIEYSSDVVIGLQFARQRYIDKENATKNSNQPKVKLDHDVEKQRNPRHIELKLLKNRNGETGKSLDFRYNALFNHFEDTKDDLSEPFTFTGELAQQIGKKKYVEM